jgi:hypothetical protein
MGEEKMTVEEALRALACSHRGAGLGHFPDCRQCLATDVLDSALRRSAHGPDDVDMVEVLTYLTDLAYTFHDPEDGEPTGKAARLLESVNAIGRLSAQHARDVAALAERDRRIAELEAETYRSQVQLAGCSVAASGWSQGEGRATRDMYGWSVAYQDVCDLRDKFEASEARVADLQAKLSAAEADKQTAVLAERENLIYAIVER